MDTQPSSTDLERQAADIALRGSRRQRLGVALRAGYNLLRDPKDTRQVFVMGLCLNGKRLPELVGRMVLSDDGLDLVQRKPSIDGKHVDYAALRRLPDGTLGREYTRFLDDNNLDPDLFGDPPGLPPTAAFVARRMRQSHDIWHVLTGYGSDIPGEVALQAFTFAQLGAPSALAIAIAGCLRWGLVAPSMFRDAARAYRLGKRAQDLAPVQWEKLWATPIDQLRATLALS